MDSTVMQMHIGVKLVRPIAMNRRDYNTYRGWEFLADENGDDEGFLIEYLDGGKANHPDHVGYISWSPKSVFEQAYFKCSGLPFGHALEAAKKGMKIAREGWYGKGMFVYVVPAASYPAQTGAAKEFFGEDAMVPYNAYMAIKSPDGVISTWVPSSTDTLADDWCVVD